MEKKKPEIGDFVVWCLIHGVLTIVTLGIWGAILTAWIIYKVDRAT